MDHVATPPAPARRMPSTLLVGLAVLGVAIAALVVRPSLDGAATDGAVPEGQVIWAPAPSGSTTRLGAPPQPQHRPDGDDGVIPDGAAVTVFDRDVPAVGNLDPDLLDALHRAAADAEADGVGLLVNSGWRSPEYQAQLLRDAVAEHGSADEAARWVATPERSLHVSGDAVDIGPADAAAWLAEHGAAHGLCPTYGNEPWHFELRTTAADEGCPAMYADPTEDPRMQP